MQKIEVKIVNKSNNPIPEYATGGSAGMDLRAYIEEPGVTAIGIPPGKRRLIKTGLHIQLPKGYECQVRPRSGLAYKNGVTVLNSPGTIDCVPAGTQIRTLQGNVKVEDIFNNFEKPCEVLSYNIENDKIEIDFIKDQWIVDNIELLEIETDTGNIIKIPTEKEVYTQNGWKKAIELTLNDKILEIE